jgi:hypothetical protein
MLSLSSDSHHLLRAAGVLSPQNYEQLRPPVPLWPFGFTLVGRLSSLGALRHPVALLAAVRQVSVKTALKKATPQARAQLQQQHNPQERLLHAAAAPLSAAQLSALKSEAENPRWLDEVARHVTAHPDSPVRYLLLEDPLHPNSVSRFHFLVKREPPLPQHAPAVDAATVSPTPQYRYFVQDLGSLNGVYIDNTRIAQGQWHLLAEGARLRFAPQTRNAKLCIQTCRSAAALTEMKQREAASAGLPLPDPIAPVLPHPLTIKDLHMELTFTHEVNEAGRRRIAQLDSLQTIEEEEQVRVAPAAPSMLLSARAVPPSMPASASAPAAASSIPSGVAATPALSVPPVTSPDYHQNSVALALRDQLDASKSAYLARFRSPRPASEQQMQEEEVMDLSELNAAPVPSNFDPNAPPVPSRKRPRAQAAAATAAAAAANSSAAPSVEGSAPKRPRGNAAAAGRDAHPSAMAGYLLFSREIEASVRRELRAQRSAIAPGAIPDAGRQSLEGEITNKVAARWRALTAEEKAAWNARASAATNAAVPASAPAAAFASAAAAVPSSSLSALMAQAADRVHTPSSFALAGGLQQSGRSAAEAVELSSDDEEDRPIIRNSVHAAHALPPPPQPALAAAAAAAASPLPAPVPAPLPVAATAAPPLSTPVPVPLQPLRPLIPLAMASLAATHAPPAPPPESSKPAAHVVPAAFNSIMENSICGICADIIYQTATLGCGHAYCRSCILEWFRKKKICPVCRTKHKGAPTPSRFADHTIDTLVQQCLNEEEKKERAQRIAKIDQMQREQEQKKSDKAALALLQKQIAQGPNAAAATGAAMPMQAVE